MKVPAQYTTVEGGVWQQWPGGALEDYVLEEVYGIPYITLLGRSIHALRFEDGTEWDSLKGWRKVDPNAFIPGSFPDYIDNSMRDDFMRCHHSWYFRYILRRVPMIPSIHLHAGAAFAKGLEVARTAYFDEGADADTAVYAGWRTVVESYHDYITGPDDVKTAERMGEALVYYFACWPLGEDTAVPHKIGSKSLVEVSFALPMDICHPVTGNPIVYCGRFDSISAIGGVLYVQDEKTASQLGPSWGRKYEMSSQFTGYVLGAKKYGLPIAGVLIRGISILKTTFGHTQHIMSRPDWVVNRWWEQLHRDVEAMIQAWKSGYYDYNIGSGCSMYAGCDYMSVCSSQNEQEWINGSNFTQNKHDPLGFYSWR